MPRALLSVSDKTGIEDFARTLTDLGYEILSTGGTQKALEAAGIAVTPVEDATQFPECFGGRVKTMHPAIMGGVLFRRDNDQDIAEAKQNSIEPIDIIVVNLYPFEETSKKEGVTRAELIENIDIGGPTLLRSAAKNHAHVTVICDIADYDRVSEELRNDGQTSDELRQELAHKVFVRTAAYDGLIAQTLTGGEVRSCVLTNGIELRYGENPHQKGWYFDHYENQVACGDDRTRTRDRTRSWTVIQEEKQMSYLNILDADGAWNLVKEFTEPTAACIKHANPSGVASHEDIAEAFQRSYDADRLSAFGVIVALNRPCTKEVLQKIIEQKIFTEVIIAPGYEDDALELLKKRPKLRALAINADEATSGKGMARHAPNQHSCRCALGGMLIQDSDTKVIHNDDIEYITDTKPTEEQIADLLFAWKVVKHAKSNAIVFAKDQTTVGIGCGQTSRVDSTIIAARRAGERSQGAVMASDAFFPFADSVEEAANNGITAIIQPGGSKRDDEVIAKANELGIGMVFTGTRAFRH